MGAEVARIFGLFWSLLAEDEPIDRSLPDMWGTHSFLSNPGGLLRVRWSLCGLWALVACLVLYGVSLPLQAADLTVEEIIDRAQSVASEEPTSVAHTFLRRVVVRELKSNGDLASEKSKVYRAYTDGREQTLLKIDGRPPTEEELVEDGKRHRKRKRRYLNDPARGEQTAGSKAKLMGRNIELFHEKFTPELEGDEMVGSRQAYVIRLHPNPEHRLDSRTMDRIFNQLSLRVWIDQEEFQVAKLEAQLENDVSFFGGIAGALKGLTVSVEQARLSAHQWVDQTVSAFFDARVLWNSYHFLMNSRSSEFETVDE